MTTSAWDVFSHIFWKWLWPDSVALMPFVDSRWPARGIFWLLSLVGGDLLQEWKWSGWGLQLPACLPGDFDLSLSASNMSSGLRASLLHSTKAALKCLMGSPQQPLTFGNFLPLLTSKALFSSVSLCWGPFVLRPQPRCRSPCEDSFCWVSFNQCEKRFGVLYAAFDVYFFY